MTIGERYIRLLWMSCLSKLDLTYNLVHWLWRRFVARFVGLTYHVFSLEDYSIPVISQRFNLYYRIWNII